MDTGEVSPVTNASIISLYLLSFSSVAYYVPPRHVIDNYATVRRLEIESTSRTHFFLYISNAELWFLSRSLLPLRLLKLPSGLQVSALVYPSLKYLRLLHTQQQQLHTLSLILIPFLSRWLNSLPIGRIVGM